MKTAFSYNINVLSKNESCENGYYQTIKLGTQSPDDPCDIDKVHLICIKSYGKP